MCFGCSFGPDNLIFLEIISWSRETSESCFWDRSSRSWALSAYRRGCVSSGVYRYLLYFRGSVLPERRGIGTGHEIERLGRQGCGLIIIYFLPLQFQSSDHECRSKCLQGVIRDSSNGKEWIWTYSWYNGNRTGVILSAENCRSYQITIRIVNQI